jgi:hypothetical protein
MASEYKSKHGTVSRAACELYMNFVDCSRFVEMIPEDKRSGVTADYDSIKATVQGFSIGVRIVRREPYKLIMLEDDGAPFHFGIDLHFDETDNPSKTDFYINVTADLNLMMKMMLGSKIQEGLNKIVDGLVAASEGRMPEGVDPEMLKNFKF